MSIEKTEAIVIRQADFSESSRVVTFFSRDHGRISTVAKGAKRLKGPFEAALDLLAVCRIVFLRKSSSSLDILTEAQLAQRFRPNQRSLSSLYGGYYVAELLDSLTEEYDPHPVLYEEARNTLNLLSQEGETGLVILRFELIMLREIGQLPAFDFCVGCGEPLEKGPFAFWVSQGGLICPRCQKEGLNRHGVDAGTVELLRALSTESNVLAERLAVSASQMQQMRTLLTSAISHVLGRRPKMLRYLQPEFRG
ncbi:MAG: DNA repair protein RecO [Planctomycetaceae bacterium]